jgi:hypothetical protein
MSFASRFRVVPVLLAFGTSMTVAFAVPRSRLPPNAPEIVGVVIVGLVARTMLPLALDAVREIAGRRRRAGADAAHRVVGWRKVSIRSTTPGKLFLSGGTSAVYRNCAEALGLNFPERLSEVQARSRKTRRAAK